jgi:hypothetical protein
VKSGYGTVTIALLVLGALGAPKAGRVGESNGGGPWAEPGQKNARVFAQPCGEVTFHEPRELVFETVEPGDLDADDIRRLAAGGHEVVSFQWNAGTGELTYDTSAPTGVFSDLALSSQASFQVRPLCVSR